MFIKGFSLSHPPLGYLAFVLHCHLPFVRHPEHEYFLEENWYYEAMFESYIPLLIKLEGLAEKEIPFKINLSVSPTLLSMWADPLLQARAVRHVDNLLALLHKEMERVGNTSPFRPVVEMYFSKLSAYREKFIHHYRCDLTLGLRKLMESGRVELIACAATHGYLPLIGVREEAVKAQVEVALKFHKIFFGVKSTGFWLPECGYQTGLEEVLERQGIRYFLLDTHGLLYANPRPYYGTFAPARCPSGAVVFARDTESSKEVWSSKEGYPGDPDYRDFYRDIGYDLEESYLAPFVKPEGIRRFTGLKYFRVTGGQEPKEPYDPQKGIQRAMGHAVDFLEKRVEQLTAISRLIDRPPLAVCMYDAELFGHWWYEGPDFLEGVFEKNQLLGLEMQFVTLSEYLEQYPRLQTVEPSPSSWGFGGYSEFWLNESNDWIYASLTKACDLMVEQASHQPRARGLTRRALNQAARELLLAQASDWPFMMKIGNNRSYAEMRFRKHLESFHELCRQNKAQEINRCYLEDLEQKDNIFPDIDYRVYQNP